MGDKELLLHVGKSDSDVEEFKLPPKRNRKTRARKNVGEPHIISTSSSGILSVKCVFTFVLVSIFLSGILLLAFYLLTMQSSISQLKNDLKEAGNNSGQTTTLAKTIKQMESKLKSFTEYSKKRIADLETENENMKKELKQLKSNVETLQSGNGNKLSRRIELVEQDVSTIKSGLAHTGGEIGKLEDKMNSGEDAYDKLHKQVTKLTQEHQNINQNGLISPSRSDISKPTSSPVDFSDYVNKDDFARQIANITKLYTKQNNMLKDLQKVNSKTVAKESNLLLELTNLKTVTDSLKITQHDDLHKLTTNITLLQNATALLQDTTNRLTLEIHNVSKQTGIKVVTPTEEVHTSTQTPTPLTGENFMSLLSTTRSHAVELDQHHKQLELLEDRVTKLNETMIEKLKQHSVNKDFSIVENKDSKSSETGAVPTTLPSAEEIPTTMKAEQKKPVNSVEPTTKTTTEPTTVSSVVNVVTASPTAKPLQATIKNVATELLKSKQEPNLKESESESTTEKPSVTETIQQSSTTLVPVGPVLPKEGGFPKDNFVPLSPNNDDKQSEKATEVPNPTEVLLTSTSKGEAHLPTTLKTTDEVMVSKENLQNPVFEQAAEKESEKDFQAFQSIETSKKKTPTSDQPTVPSTLHSTPSSKPKIPSILKGIKRSILSNRQRDARQEMIDRWRKQQLRRQKQQNHG